MSIHMTQAAALAKAKSLFEASGVASARGMSITNNSQRSMAMFEKSNRLADEADVLINLHGLDAEEVWGWA